MNAAPAPLRHLAIVADGLPAAGAAAVTAAFASPPSLAAAALAAAPDLEAVTFFAPAVRDAVRAGDAAAVRACAAGLRRLAAAARAQGARFRLLGRPDRLPEALRLPLPGAAGAGPVVGWFLDYGARDEILRAAARVPPGAAIDEEGFAGLLDTAGLPDPDLVVSVGGAFEPKDFLLWQASYAELWHTGEPWPAFSPELLRAAIADFSRRQRRFGA